MLTWYGIVGTVRGGDRGLLSISRQGFNRHIRSSIQCINDYHN